MTSPIEVISMARALARHASVRQNLISENIANADTVDFKARDISDFSEIYESKSRNQKTGASHSLDASFAPRVTRPGHPGYEDVKAAVAPTPEAKEIAKLGAETRNGNTVSLEDQMTRGASAMLHHEMAIGVMRKAGDILRMAIGRAR